MLPSAGPCPMLQKMQLKAVNVAFLARDENTPWKGFSTHIKPAPNSPGPWKRGFGSSCHTSAKLCDQTANLDLPARASYSFLCGSPGGLANAQVVKCAVKSFISSLILSKILMEHLPVLGAGAEVLWERSIRNK